MPDVPAGPARRPGDRIKREAWDQHSSRVVRQRLPEPLPNRLRGVAVPWHDHNLLSLVAAPTPRRGTVCLT